MEKFFTVSEVARELGKSTDWLRDAERRRKIPTAKRDFNGRLVYTAQDIAIIRDLIIPSVK
jgi:DNA-binding transcriptional MerR regulator